MKQIYRHFFASWPFFVVAALLLCFGSCQSSDNTKAEEGALVASLPLTACIGDASSRVGMTDIYNSTFSCYWNSDKLNIYQKYRLEGLVQNMTALEFATSTTSGTSATFSYTGNGTYCYNPSSRLYAFSKGTSGGYAASVAEDGTSTLTAPTLASQTGTLTDCATYDALYGSTSMKSTGLPESLAIHHLFGMLNIHITSSSLSKNYPVTVTLTSSAANILPGNSGSATFKADGTLNTLTGSWNTSWTATVTPTTDGVVDVYLMTWPFTSIGGTLTVSCSDASNYVYIPRKVTLSALSLDAAQLKSKPMAITNVPFTYDSSTLFAWDAKDFQPVTMNKVPDNNNDITIGRAEYACQKCPNYNEISWYLSVPSYWDSGVVNNTSYKRIDGSTIKAGMWFRKKSGIAGFSSTTPSGITTGTVIALTADLATSLNLTTDYFFLPAVGWASFYDGSFQAGLPSGTYWSSTPTTSTSNAYYLSFDNAGVRLYYGDGGRTNGYCLWQVQ